MVSAYWSVRFSDREAASVHHLQGESAPLRHRLLSSAIGLPNYSRRSIASYHLSRPHPDYRSSPIPSSSSLLESRKDSFHAANRALVLSHHDGRGTTRNKGIKEQATVLATGPESVASLDGPTPAAIPVILTHQPAIRPI